MKCQMAGHGVAEGMQAAFRLDQRRVGGGKDHARGAQRQRDDARLDRAHADRLGGLVAAAGHHRRARRPAGLGGRGRRSRAR